MDEIGRRVEPDPAAPQADGGPVELLQLEAGKADIDGLPDEMEARGGDPAAPLPEGLVGLDGTIARDDVERSVGGDRFFERQVGLPFGRDPFRALDGTVPAGAAADFPERFAALPEAERTAVKRVVTKSGDYMTKIAKANGLTAKQINMYNPQATRLKNGNLTAGQRILVRTINKNRRAIRSALGT